MTTPCDGPRSLATAELGATLMAEHSVTRSPGSRRTADLLGPAGILAGGAEMAVFTRRDPHDRGPDHVDLGRDTA